MISVAFYGTCQLGCVEQVIRRYLAPHYGFSPFFVAAWTDLADADRVRVEQADVFVGQRLRFGSSAEGLSIRGRALMVPVVTNAFLWPFTGEAHPHNATYPFHPYGPYPAEFGDSYLNRQIAAGVDPDTAVERYLALDVNAVVRLDRLREMSMDHQHLLDEETGFRMAPVIEDFRAAPLFRSAYHFELRVLVELACQVSARLGLDAAADTELRRSVRQNPMLDAWAPIHPAVARHFGLSHGGPDQRYRYFDEGMFTFAEYARRYMACVWNRPLHEGVALAVAGDDAAAVPKLRAGVALAQGSAHAHLRLSQSLERCGDPAEAAAAAARAVALAPDDAGMRDALSRTRLLSGDAEGALAEALSAVRLDPSDADRQAFLAWLLQRRGELEAALRHVVAAIALAPQVARSHLLRGDILLGLGRAAEAAASFREAGALDPELPAAPAGLARALLEAGQPDAALEAVEQAMPLAPDDADNVYLTARIQAARANVAEAEVACRQAVAIAPGRADLHAGLAMLLYDEGRHPDALQAIDEAVQLADDNRDYRALRTHLREVLGLEA